jgi:hypothetical protein
MVGAQAQEGAMSLISDRLPISDDIVAIAERASLFGLLQAALRRQGHPQELPRRLYDDLGVPPSQRPDFTPHCR